MVQIKNMTEQAMLLLQEMEMTASRWSVHLQNQIWSATDRKGENTGVRFHQQRHWEHSKSPKQTTKNAHQNKTPRHGQYLTQKVGCWNIVNIVS